VPDSPSGKWRTRPSRRFGLSHQVHRPRGLQLGQPPRTRRAARKPLTATLSRISARSRASLASSSDKSNLEIFWLRNDRLSDSDLQDPAIPGRRNRGGLPSRPRPGPGVPFGGVHLRPDTLYLPPQKQKQGRYLPQLDADLTPIRSGSHRFVSWSPPRPPGQPGGLQRGYATPAPISPRHPGENLVYSIETSHAMCACNVRKSTSPLAAA